MAELARLLLDHTDPTGACVLLGPDDPTTLSGGVAAAIGTLLVSRTTGDVFRKTGSGNTNWKRLGPPGADVRDFGAKGIGSGDDGPAFSAAFQSGESRIVIPKPTSYWRLATPVDCTGLSGLTIDCHGSLAQGSEPIRFAHNGVGFDCTASSQMVWNTPAIVNAVGFAPTCGWLLARDSSLSGAGTHRFNSPHGSGGFQRGFIYNYGSEENEFTDAFWYATSAATPVMTHTATNINSLASTFKTIATGAQSTSTLRHRGGSYHNAGTGALKTLFILDAVSDLSFTRQFWYCPGGLAFIQALGSVNFVDIENIRCEPGVDPIYAVKFENPSIAAVSSYWALEKCQMSALTNVVHADDLSEIQHLTYRKISDVSTKGISVKNASYLDFRGFNVVGRAGGLIEHSVFTGPQSTWTFSGTEQNNTFIDTTASTLSRPLSFTPVIAIGAGTVTSYTTQIGRYTKIGDRVFFNIYLVINVLGAATGTVSVTGLPIAANALGSENHVVAIKVDGGNLPAGWHTAYISAGGTAVNMQYTTNGSPTVNANMAQSHLNNATSIMLAGSYRV